MHKYELARIDRWIGKYIFYYMHKYELARIDE